MTQEEQYLNQWLTTSQLSEVSFSKDETNHHLWTIKIYLFRSNGVLFQKLLIHNPPQAFT